jgi:hypothetical protein
VYVGICKNTEEPAASKFMIVYLEDGISRFF